MGQQIHEARLLYFIVSQPRQSGQMPLTIYVTVSASKPSGKQIGGIATAGRHVI